MTYKSKSYKFIVRLVDEIYLKNVAKERQFYGKNYNSLININISCL